MNDGTWRGPLKTGATAAPRTSRTAQRRAEPAVVLDRRRVFILPTLQGLAFALACAVMLLGSVNYDNSLGYMLVFLLGSLGLVSMLHTWRNLAGLRVRAGKAPGVFAGEAAHFQVCLQNPDRSPRHVVELEYLSDPAGRRRSRRSKVTLMVPAQGVQCADLIRAAPRRGRLRLGPAAVATRFPLGMFRAWSAVDLGMSCLVYPRPAGTRTLPAPAPNEEHSGSGRGSGHEDFSGFRDFAHGDSPRRVHWKAAARDQGLVVKLFAGGAQGELVLRWDEAGPQTDVEGRLSQLCLWVLEAEHLGQRYGLELPQARIPPEHGEAHRQRCLRALALFGEPDA